MTPPAHSSPMEDAGGERRRKGSLAAALGLILLMSVALIPLALWSLFRQARAPADIALHVVFVLIVAEKLVSMFVRMQSGRVPPPMRDASMALVGGAFTGMMYAVFATLWLGQAASGGAVARASGLALYAASAGLHYWASQHLARALRERSENEGGYSLVTSGPYAAVRHPIYLAACMESLAIPLIFLSAAGLAVTVLLFIPLEILRGIKEDRYVRNLFGARYDAYASRVPRLWPRLRAPEHGG